ncbi:HEPACAM family member 2-like [Acanthochromis polyacanthus]|uniref:HEPACAM family member 2-like n=1 Tax=Acanthochromis polyacanthus TaxID=80966 RepID=UPI002234AA5B|nr:HEPACAM family member 2-like [Acanthochromis polyacanthus]
MRQPLVLISLSLAVLLPANVLAQDQVQIQFQVDPVLVQTSTEAVFTVLTVPEVLSMTWTYQGGVTLGLWAGGAAVVNPVAQFQGRVTITATQLRIGGAQLRDAGNYSVEVIPTATTGLGPNSRSIQLRVFDAVAGVSLFVPSVAVEGANVSLSCTWTAGTEITVQWDKGGSAIIADSRITISRGSLVINPARRSDAGEYTCTASNPVSAQEATQSLTVYCEFAVIKTSGS